MDSCALGLGYVWYVVGGVEAEEGGKGEEGEASVTAAVGQEQLKAAAVLPPLW